MEFFFVNKDTSYIRKTSRGRLLVKYSSPTKEEIESKKVNLSHLYFATPSLIEITRKEIKTQEGNGMVVLNEQDKNTLFNTKQFPINLTAFGGNDVVTNIQKLIDTKKSSIKICIVNGFGAAIGDIIVGTTAIDIYDKFLRQYFRDIKYFVYNEHLDAAKETLENNYRINGILPYPTPVATLLNFDAFLDLGSMIAWNIFNDRPMIDFYLSAFGLKHDNIPGYFKRTKLFYKLDPATELNRFLDGFRLGRKLLLFNPESTTLVRSIPSDTIPRIIKDLVDNTDYQIVTFKDYYKDKRVTSLGEYSKTLLDYIYVISKMDKIITVDTSTYHISDYFSIPTIVLFTTIKPEYRIKYYPFVKPYKVLPETSSINGKHISQNKDDEDYIRIELQKLDIKNILKLWEDK